MLTAHRVSSIYFSWCLCAGVCAWGMEELPAVLSAVTEPSPQRPSWSAFLPAMLTLTYFPTG